jgi:hypothetical protein
MAFVRLDFPPSQRDTAQVVAALFGHFIGPAMLRLRPEHTIGEILSWTESAGLGTVELLMVVEEEYGEMDDEFARSLERHTFREFVEHLSRETHSRQT